jgi:thiol-disulfide isomerase/thioredoxin
MPSTPSSDWQDTWPPTLIVLTMKAQPDSIFCQERLMALGTSPLAITVRRLDPYDFTRWAAALLLLAAAVLKAHAVVTGPLTDGLLTSRPLVMLLIEGEFLFAVLLATGFFRTHVRFLAIGLFALLAVAAAYEAFSGAASCGCFGRVQVDPRVTLSFDLLLLAALVIFSPSRPSPAAPSGRTLAVLLLPTIAVAAAGGLFMATHGPTVLADDLPSGSGVVVLDSDTWIGKRLPILKHIDVGDRLATGDWVVLLHRAGCHTCEAALPVYRQLAAEGEFVAGKPGVALIAMPSEEPLGQVSGRHLELTGRLLPDRDWFATTPVALLLHDGIVLETASGEAAATLDWLTASKNSQVHPGLIGTPLTLEGNLIDGTPFSTATWHGKVVLVDFWATWCGPCVASIPELRRLYDQYHGAGLEIVSFALDKTPDVVLQFLDSPEHKAAMTWPQLYTGARAAADRLEVREIPTVMLIDAQGNVRYAGPPANVERYLRSLLAR